MVSAELEHPAAIPDHEVRRHGVQQLPLFAKVFCCPPSVRSHHYAHLKLRASCSGRLADTSSCAGCVCAGASGRRRGGRHGQNLRRAT